MGKKKKYFHTKRSQIGPTCETDGSVGNPDINSFEAGIIQPIWDQEGAKKERNSFFRGRKLKNGKGEGDGKGAFLGFRPGAHHLVGKVSPPAHIFLVIWLVEDADGEAAEVRGWLSVATFLPEKTEIMDPRY